MQLRGWPAPAERRRFDVWRSLVALVATGAGLLFVASAHTARGTDLRSTGRSRLTELIAAQERRVRTLDATAARLRAEVDRATGDAATGNETVRMLNAANDELGIPVGLSALTGPGLSVSLDDAPRLAAGEQRPGNPSPDDLVVHEQDVLSVINALWAGGADAVSVMGERIIGTSVVRCAGNTLLLHDAVYSPPFVIAAIGDQDRLLRALDVSRGVQLFRSYVAAYGLGYQAKRVDTLAMPAYDGPVSLTTATVVR